MHSLSPVVPAPHTVADAAATAASASLSTAPVSAALFREGMAKVATAVHVITTDGPAGRAGFTASAVCSVTDTPPTLLVCLNRNASVYATFHRNHVLCVNTLSAHQQAIAAVFGGKTPMHERFAAAAWADGVTAAPVLQQAAATFECRIAQAMPVGTHDVLFCEVLSVTRTDAPGGLIYCDRQYHHIAHDIPLTLAQPPAAERPVAIHPGSAPPA